MVWMLAGLDSQSESLQTNHLQIAGAPINGDPFFGLATLTGPLREGVQCRFGVCAHADMNGYANQALIQICICLLPVGFGTIAQWSANDDDESEIR